MVKRDKPLLEQNPVSIQICKSNFYKKLKKKYELKINYNLQIKIQESINVLTHMCSAVTSIGFIILVFGQSYSSTLLWLYGGAKLTSNLPVLLLRAHCLAILLLGINGVTECYTNATADSATINKNNLIMIYESVAFLGGSYLFVIWFGPVGFILGNCFNMSLRIAHSMIFINKRHSGAIHNPLLGLVPKRMFSITLLLAAVITNFSHVKKLFFTFIYNNFKILKLS